MKKMVFGLIGILLILSLLLTACSTATTSTTTTPASTTPPPQTTSVTSTTSAATTPAATTPATTTVSTPTQTAPAATTVAPSTTPAQTGQKRGGVMTIIVNAGPLAFGVPTLLGLDANSINASIPAIQQLFNYDAAGQAHPVLATNWVVNSEAKTITFTLRQGVKFSDGTVFDANAAAWNLQQFIDQKISQASNWSGMAVLDPYTVQVKLKQFSSTALAAFDGSAGMMISPTAYQKNGLDWAKTNPVGTGPFMLKSFKRDSSVEYERNPNYWEPGKPFLDGIKFVIITDPVTARIAFEAGQGDVLFAATGDVTKALQAKGYNVETRPAAAMVLVPDSKNATSPLSKLKVRQAIDYALDKKTISDTLGFGYWEAMTQPAIASQYGYTGTAGHAYNVATAKQLLADAGYPNGFPITLTTSSTFAQDVVTSMQGYLKDVGITVKVNSITFAAWNSMVSGGWSNALLWVTMGVTDAEYISFLDRYFADNSTRYPSLSKPQPLLDLINQAKYEPDYAKRVALCKQAVQVMIDDQTVIAVYGGTATFVEQKYVKDAHFDSLAMTGFRWDTVNAWMDK